MTAVVFDDRYRLHLTGEGHPECPARYDAVLSGVSHTLTIPLTPRYAKEEEILLCHTKDYFDLLKNETSNLSDHACAPLSTSPGDTIICGKSFDVALLAAGGVLTAVDAVLSHHVKNAFCAVRPPGHHACSNMGMGFCLFNNVAIGARYAQRKYDLRNILIVDWDVHHGNGTQEIFDNDPTVFYFSTHQANHYPHPSTGRHDQSGVGIAEGTKINIPIQGGYGSREKVLQAFHELLEKAMEKKNFHPDLVFISAGFDGRIHDPLGGFNLTDDDFSELTTIMKSIADKYAKGRLISVLEGGYNLNGGLMHAVKAHVSALER